MKAISLITATLFAFHAWCAEPEITLITTRNITDWARAGQERTGFEFKAVSNADVRTKFHGFNCLADSEDKKLVDGLYLYLFVQNGGMWEQLFVAQIDGLSTNMSTILFADPFPIGTKETVQFRVRFKTSSNTSGMLTLGLSDERVPISRIRELLPEVTEALPLLAGSVIPGATTTEDADIPVRLGAVGTSRFTVYQPKMHTFTFSVLAGVTYHLELSEDLTAWKRVQPVMSANDQLRVNMEIAVPALPTLFLRLVPAQ